MSQWLLLGYDVIPMTMQDVYAGDRTEGRRRERMRRLKLLLELAHDIS